MSNLKRILNPNGKCVVVGFSKVSKMFQVLFIGGWITKTSSKKIVLMHTQTNSEDLKVIKDMVEKNIINPIIEKIYSSTNNS